jgi:hypothetical protein
MLALWILLPLRFLLSNNDNFHIKNLSSCLVKSVPIKMDIETYRQRCINNTLSRDTAVPFIAGRVAHMASESHNKKLNLDCCVFNPPVIAYQISRHLFRSK